MPSNDKRLLFDGHAAGHVRTGKEGGAGEGLATTGANKQLNRWTDGQLVMLNTFHIPLCVISQCLSFPPAIYLFGSGESQIFLKKKKK